MRPLHNRVSIFIDGSNFVASMKFRVYKKLVRTTGLKFDELANWLAVRAGSTGPHEVHYYTSKPQDSEKRSQFFIDRDRAVLNELRRTPGFRVYEFGRGVRDSKCGKCGHKEQKVVEKLVDTSIVADMIEGAYQNRYDTAILISNDLDISIAPERVIAAGKRCIIAAWPSTFAGTMALKKGIPLIDLDVGLKHFIPEELYTWPGEKLTAEQFLVLHALQRTESAQQRLGLPLLRNYIFQKMSLPFVPVDVRVLRARYNELILFGLIEEYTLPNRDVAVRFCINNASALSMEIERTG